MSQLLKKQPPKTVQKVGTNSVQKTPEKSVQNIPKEQECAGWCGEVFPINELTTYKKKVYCKSCLEIKQNEVKKPAGLNEEAVKAIVNKEYAAFSSQTYTLFEKVKELEAKIAESPNFQLRDLVITARTIFAHLAGLERFTSKRMNGRQGDDMRAWLESANKILEGK